MADIKIELSEKELREKFEAHVNEKIKLASISDILKDETFKRHLIESQIGVRPFGNEVRIQVR